MRLDKLTVKAQEAMQEAQSLADRNGNQEITSEHLLLALLDQPEGIVTPILQKLGAQPAAIRAELEREIARIPKVSGVSGQVYLSARQKRTLDVAWDEAQRLKDEYVSTEHLLIAIAGESEGASGRILRANGVTRDRIFQARVDVRGSAPVTDPYPEEKYQALERYGRDLTELARRV
jgi:ATP-dependent Clp protease ATP-binding subunit ClpB